MEDEDYVVAAAAGAAGTRGARRLRRDAVRHRAWRAERIGALGHRVAVRASATESGAEEDEAGAAFKWKWNIDGGELFEECLRRAKTPSGRGICLISCAAALSADRQP